MASRVFLWACAAVFVSVDVDARALTASSIKFHGAASASSSTLSSASNRIAPRRNHSNGYLSEKVRRLGEQTPNDLPGVAKPKIYQRVQATTATELLDELHAQAPGALDAPLSLEGPFPDEIGPWVDQRSLPTAVDWCTKLLLAATAVIAIGMASREKGHGHGHGEPESGKEQAPMTKWELIISLVNLMVGLCLLAVPFCLARTGAIGFVSFVVVGVGMCGTAMLLGKCIKYVSDLPEMAGVPAPQLDWILVCQTAFGRAGSLFAAAIMPVDLFFHILNCILVSGHLMPALLPADSISFMGSVLFCGIVTFVVCLVPARHLASLMALGAASQVCLVVSLIVTAALLTWMAPETIGNDIDTPVTPTMVFGVFGVFVGSYNVHAMLPYFYFRLDDRKEWDSALAISMCITIAFIGPIGIACLILFGDATREIFAENLGHTSRGDALTGFGFLRPVCCGLLALQQLTMAPAGWQAITSMIGQVHHVGVCTEFMLGVALVGCACGFAAAGSNALPFIIAGEGDLVDFPIGVIFPVLAFAVLYWSQLNTCSKVFLIGGLVTSIVLIMPGEVIDAEVLLGMRTEE